MFLVLRIIYSVIGILFTGSSKKNIFQWQSSNGLIISGKYSKYSDKNCIYMACHDLDVFRIPTFYGIYMWKLHFIL